MPLRRAQSEGEKAAKAAQKETEREARASEKAAADEQTRLRKESERRERERQAFAVSPAGQARAAFGRGDRLFQFFMDVKDTKPVVIPMTGATTTTSTADPTAILNSVCNEGWELVNGSFVFHELGSESRDKFLASGQNVAVRGTIIGYYLFKRCQENRVKSQDPWNIPHLERACPHCGTQMQADASICPHCHVQSDAWQFQHGRWWRTVDGEWYFLDDSRHWQKHSAQASPAASDSRDE
jgi:hypothetical protein